MHTLGGFTGYDTWNGRGSSGLEASTDKGERGAGAWGFKGNRHFIGSWGRAEHTCQAMQKQCGVGDAPGAFLPAAKVRLLRFPSWNSPIHLNLLGRKGKGHRFFLSLLFLNNQLKTNIPKGAALGWQDSGPLHYAHGGVLRFSCFS